VQFDGPFGARFPALHPRLRNAACKRDPLAYASAAERMLRAIGEPQTVDTRNDPRLSRLFANKVIKIYPAFAEFYGMEDAIEQVVSYFRHAAQGLEERSRSSTCSARSAAARVRSPSG
jgi:predicted Ser/Thr protein kinase